MNSLVTIIIPTWNNYQYLRPCIESILNAKMAESLFDIVVVNNGHEDSCNWISRPEIKVINAGDNLGWEGGLKLGLKHTTAPFVVFMNDDTHIPTSSRDWLNLMLETFNNPKVGAVGPSSNVVLGYQNIFSPSLLPKFERKFLIGFCMVVRRSALDEVGGVDDSLPGGDDFDLSIRLRDAGYMLVCDKNVFVFHHGFKTGTRVKGDSTKEGGWNSYGFKEKTDFALIRKHGLKKWWEVIKNAWEQPKLNYYQSMEDVEGDRIREVVGSPDGKLILDLGCGGRKTFESAVGVDMIKENDVIDTLGGTKSVADVEADVSKPLEFKDVDVVIARHIIEHMDDVIEVLENWHKMLKKDGLLIMATPDCETVNFITMNVEHLHGFTKKSLAKLMEKAGYRDIKFMDSGNNISFIIYGKK